MFETLDEGNFSMDKIRTDDIPQIFMEDNDLLIAEYSEEELRKTVLKRNTTKHQMAFQLNFIKFSWVLGSSKIV
jgi:hypothetical protein